MSRAVHQYLSLSLAAGLTVAALVAEAAPRHGLSVFGNLAMPPQFEHFEYVNPGAPKGGEIRFRNIGTFETVNPFILKGRKEPFSPLMFDTLMTRSLDEPDARYALVAQSVEQTPGRDWVIFNLDPRARFHDGSAVTAEDVVFTFNILREKGDPGFRNRYRDVDRVDIISPGRVKFTFRPGRHRDLAINLADMPVLSRTYYSTRAFEKTTFEAPLSSGPYRIGRIEPGRSLTYERVEDYWARDLPVNRGRFNFDRITIDYYRDREVAFQAFFSQQYDFREEFTSRQWATQYDKPPVRRGLVVREILADETPSGVQVFALNLRRARFADIRVRHALDLAFDFEWTNRTLFFGLYRRTNSMFENSALAARNPPTEAELKLLDKWRHQLPEEVFAVPFEAPVTDGSGNNRRNLRQAAQLLRQAGYRVANGVLLDANGQPFTLEFLLFESTFTRILNPYISNLKRLGIQAEIRIVDSANFKRRQDTFDFDIIVRRFIQRLTPGLEQREYFGSRFADVEGGLNVSGIRNPVVDALIEEVVSASSRTGLETAVRALDRVLMWNRYVVTQWYKGEHNVAYWNKFGRPARKPRYSLGVVDTWWFDQGKAEMIERGTAPVPPPGALPVP